MQLTHRPIDVWPGPASRNRRDSDFKASYAKTLDLLERELSMLGASRVVLQMDVNEREIKLDGGVYANVSPATPRVALAFETRTHGPLVYRCDEFWKWQDNLRAIALGLEALRRVERYGIARRGEQYTGWKQLTAGIEMGAPMSFDEGWRVLRDLAEDPNATDVDEAYRVAARKHHPDAGGDPELFARVTQARDAILAGA